MRSDARRRAGRRAALLLVLAASAAPGAASQQATREEALASAFPGAAIRAERVFLTDEQRQRVAELAGVDAPSALVARYIATKDGQAVGRAYVDTHVVRTKPESLLVSLAADGSVHRVEVTAFLEPQEYRAPAAWLAQYHARGLDAELALQRAIRPIAGATLTARAATAAVRRVLAIDRVLQEPAGGRQP